MARLRTVGLGVALILLAGAMAYLIWGAAGGRTGAQLVLPADRAALPGGLSLPPGLSSPDARLAPATETPPGAEDGADTSALRAVGPWGKRGYVDGTGRLVIPQRFNWARAFREGLAAVRLAGKWGFVDPDGRLAIPCQYDSARSFSEGRAAVRLGEKWGYIDADGRAATEMVYEEAFGFSDGLGRVWVGGPLDPRTGSRRRADGGYGFVDATGRVVIPAELERAGDFHEGLALVFREREWIYIDKTGALVIDASAYAGSSRFSDGLAAAGDGTDGTGYIDATGDWVIKPQFDLAEPFSEGLAAVSVAGRWGYIDRRGRIVIEPRYASAEPFSEGLAAVQLSRKTPWPYGTTDYWVFVDETGRGVLADAYNQVEAFAGGLVWVHVGGEMQHKGADYQPPSWVGGHWRLIDRRGRTVWE